MSALQRCITESVASWLCRPKRGVRIFDYSSGVGRLHLIVRVVLLAAGAALVVIALRMDQSWFERHVTGPALFLPAPPWLHVAFRAAPAAGGLLLLMLARPLSRIRGRDLGRSAVAALLAIGLVELYLRRGERGTSFWRAQKLELKLGYTDPRFGWALWPSRTTLLAAPGGAKVSYSVDAWGDRAQDSRGTPDPARPSLVVAGESIAVGHGLPFEQTFAARLASILGLQLVNVAAGGYGTDQALLRLADVLPRLLRPVAVVMVVPMLQLERNVQDYRPRLTLSNGALKLVPPAQGPFVRLRLRDLIVNELPILGERKLLEALSVTSAELREAAALARTHGAEVLFLIPVVGKERPLDEHPEAQLIRHLFVEQQLPFVLCDLGPDELLPYDKHPDAAASQRIATILAKGLSLRRAR